MSDRPPLPSTVQQHSVEKLAQVLDRFVTLRVTTVIGAAHVDPGTAVDPGAATAVAFDGNVQQVVASTTLNMALGDMTQILHPDFEAKPDLAKLHQDAIATARTIRSETVTILTALVKDLAARL